jgi:hypothetical protein
VRVARRASQGEDELDFGKWFGVYDGHGGVEASDHVAANLYRNILDCWKNAGRPQGLQRLEALAKTVTDGFARTEAAFIQVARLALPCPAPHQTRVPRFLRSSLRGILDAVRCPVSSVPRCQCKVRYLALAETSFTVCRRANCAPAQRQLSDPRAGADRGAEEAPRRVHRHLRAGARPRFKL